MPVGTLFSYRKDIYLFGLVIFSVRVGREPALSNTFFLFLEFLDAPETGECDDRKDGGKEESNLRIKNDR